MVCGFSSDFTYDGEKSEGAVVSEDKNEQLRLHAWSLLILSSLIVLDMESRGLPMQSIG